MKLTLYVPSLDDLWFRRRMLEDPETMAYNHAWGGRIPWPRENWQPWYEHWVVHPEGERFYRYLQDEDTGDFVGEIAYHRNEQGLCQANVIVFAPCRGRGYGREGLRLLCQAAKENGFCALYDDIAADNSAVGLFLSEGFELVEERGSTRLLKKDLSMRAARSSNRGGFGVQ